MLNFVRRYFFNRSRQTYRFWDGIRIRHADPIVLCRALSADPHFDWNSHPALIDLARDEHAGKLAIETADESMHITAEAVRRAFDLPPFENGQGLTELECVDLLVHFTADYLLALKKNGSPLPISPAPTELPSSDASTTKPASDCGSMPVVLNTGA